ncbi:MAG: 2-polyprenyl-3-methyl-5-hydroxy-6-metoxy-1,4-benzoquinol methylase [Candidatus Endobugula sp.]|jgi:2-polyprenyl-3-methyl-5-hydroxy-6-metoxy-1,4-benzoquinol methylase
MKTLNDSYVGVRKDIISLIPKGGKNIDVLDVGCATGANGRFLLENGIAKSVTGFEFDEAMAESALEFYSEVYIGDLDVIDIKKSLEGKKFHGIILGDILEHLRSPERVLKDLLAHLEPGGFCIISVPNMQHIEACYNLFVKGVWPKNERGIFDKTHVQMFTRKNLLNLLSSAELVNTEIHRNFRFRDKIGSRFPPVIGGLLKFAFPNLFTFQYRSLSFKSN